MGFRKLGLEMCDFACCSTWYRKSPAGQGIKFSRFITFLLQLQHSNFFSEVV